MASQKGSSTSNNSTSNAKSVREALHGTGEKRRGEVLPVDGVLTPTPDSQETLDWRARSALDVAETSSTYLDEDEEDGQFGLSLVCVCVLSAAVSHTATQLLYLQKGMAVCEELLLQGRTQAFNLPSPSTVPNKQWRLSPLPLAITHSGPKPHELYGKFTWKIGNFSDISKRELRSTTFDVGGYKWWGTAAALSYSCCLHVHHGSQHQLES